MIITSPIFFKHCFKCAYCEHGAKRVRFIPDETGKTHGDYVRDPNFYDFVCKQAREVSGTLAFIGNTMTEDSKRVFKTSGTGPPSNCPYLLEITLDPESEIIR